MVSAEEKRRVWLKAFEDRREVIDRQVQEGVEKHRKGWCKLRVLDANGCPLQNVKVKITQKTHDFKYGANIFMLDGFDSEEENRAYRELFKTYFNLATVPFYWEGLEPEQGKPRYDKDSPFVYRRPAPELCMEYCEQNGIDAKVHCLLYDRFIPKWLPRSDMKAMEAAYEERFRQISERFSGRMFEFEVINEVLSEYYWTTDSVIMEKKDIVEWAFALARKYFPKETLVINDGNYLAEAASKDYRDPYYMLVENSLLKGASIDKLGIQNHMYTGVGATTEELYDREVRSGHELAQPDAIRKGLDVYASLGLPLEITEVTIPTFGEKMEDEEIQAELLRNIYAIWFSHPAVDTVVYWNTVDGYAYCTEDGSFNENRVRGGLFHHDLTPKKSALMLKKLFSEVWHTDLELTTDDNGCVMFRGFFGDYTAEAKGTKGSFGIHKNSNNTTQIQI